MDDLIQIGPFMKLAILVPTSRIEGNRLVLGGYTVTTDVLTGEVTKSQVVDSAVLTWK